ncbi:hypothetical protein BDZ94DRAFT_1264775 [Collybia nuda]|uniref:Uncharacterized protein n=1 Tax=Collybia nuda TaxID=64659 RepID=A0A9P6CCR4_9AGAR|nr:hypothetical protein BDZ94DRAFT_1264775 [Collybia nuda]
MRCQDDDKLGLINHRVLSYFSTDDRVLEKFWQGYMNRLVPALSGHVPVGRKCNP